MQFKPLPKDRCPACGSYMYIPQGSIRSTRDGAYFDLVCTNCTLRLSSYKLKKKKH